MSDTKTTRHIIERLESFANGVTECLHIDAAIRMGLLVKALDHAMNKMSRDQQANMTDPSYEEARELLK